MGGHVNGLDSSGKLKALFSGRATDATAGGLALLAIVIFLVEPIKEDVNAIRAEMRTASIERAELTKAISLSAQAVMHLREMEAKDTGQQEARFRQVEDRQKNIAARIRDLEDAVPRTTRTVPGS